MSESLPVVEVPESVWLRALAHALDADTEAEPETDDLVPADDEAAGATFVDDDSSDDDSDAEDDDADVDDITFDDPNFGDGDQLWSNPVDAHDDTDTTEGHHDDGLG